MHACEDHVVEVHDLSIELSDHAFKGFQKLIFDFAGITLSDAKKSLVSSRLHKRLRALKLADFDSYYQHLVEGDGQHDGEIQVFTDMLTTNETYFYREPEHFTFLREIASSISLQNRPFRIWSAASSSGEEAYTVAMVMANELGLDGSWEILGTDISADVIRMARTAIYNEHRVRMLPRDMQHRYLLKGKRQHKGFYAVVPELKRHVTFEHYNLLDGPSQKPKFDVIFCRNVLIYFNRDTKKKVVQRLTTQIEPGGYLITGHSESLHGMNKNMKSIRPSVYRMPGNEK